MDLGLQGKAALVVGATGDIGRAVVARLLDEGARVVVAARNMQRLQERFPDRVAGHVEIDLSDDASIAEAVAASERILGGIDILVITAAGLVKYGPLWDMTRAGWNSELALKTVGTPLLCMHVARGMVTRRSGAIIPVIGIATDMVVTSNPVGSAANSGLRSFTRVLATEVAPHGVRVVGISPGMVEGERLGRFATDQIEAIRAGIPLGTIGKPEELADVIVFAASARASYLTGAIINVDGGLTLVR